MSASALHNVSRPNLQALAGALRSGRLQPPFCAADLSDRVPSEHQGSVAAELAALREAGMSSAALAKVLELVAEERRLAQQQWDRVTLVWTGPEAVGAKCRDTGVVVPDLLKQAERSVLLSTYNIGKIGARELFAPLADKLDADPTFKVELFANIKRDWKDKSTASSELVTAFRRRFKAEIWPGKRMPKVYHDPRSLEVGAQVALHAKCVIVDDRRLLVTSANLSQPAQAGNIEAGVMIEDEAAARAMREQFEKLVARDVLVRVGGL